MSFLKTVVISLKDELSIHNDIDCKLEDVKSKLKSLVNKLEKPLQISLQNRRDRCEDLNRGTFLYFALFRDLRRCGEMIGDRVDQCLEREEQEIMRHISSLKKMIKKVSLKC